MNSLTRLKNIVKVKAWSRARRKTDDIFTIIAFVFAIFLIVSGILFILKIISIFTVVTILIGLMWLAIAFYGQPAY